MVIHFKKKLINTPALQFSPWQVLQVGSAQAVELSIFLTQPRWTNPSKINHLSFQFRLNWTVYLPTTLEKHDDNGHVCENSATSGLMQFKLVIDEVQTIHPLILKFNLKLHDSKVHTKHLLWASTLNNNPLKTAAIAIIFHIFKN